VFAVVISEKGGAERREAFEQLEISVGRVQGNDLMLPKGNVSKRHARLMLRDNRFIVTDLNSTNGTYVNRRRISQATIVREGDRIYIGDFVLRIEPSDGSGEAESGSGNSPEADADSGTASRDSADTPGRSPESLVPRVPGPPRVPSGARAQLPFAEPVDRELSRPIRAAAPEPSRPSIRTPRRVAASHPDNDALSYRVALGMLVERIESALDPGELEGERVGLASRVSQLLAEHSSHLRAEGRLPTNVDIDVLLSHARAELLGAGPFGALLDDPSVAEVVASRFDSVVVVRDQEESRVEPPFTSEAALQRAVRRLCEQASAPIRNEEEVIERRIAGGALLTAAFAPTSVRGTVVVIRKLREVRSMLDDLVRRGMASAPLASFLEQCVAARVNLLVTGPRDAGTSRVVSALCAAAAGAQHVLVQRTSEVVPAEDATIFSAAGDSKQAPRLVALGALIPGARLVVELVSPELSESLLAAVASGVEGAIGVAYASSMRRALARVPADLMAAHPGLAAHAAREWVAATFDIIVELGRLADGRSRVLSVSEVSGTRGDEIATQEIFSFMVENTSPGGQVQGKFAASGAVPRVAAELRSRGVAVDMSLFGRPR